MNVIEPLGYLDNGEILNFLCVLLFQLAPVENETKVVMPQTKAAMYYLSKEVGAEVFRIVCEPANWQPALDLIAQYGQLPDHQYSRHLGFPRGWPVFLIPTSDRQDWVFSRSTSKDRHISTSS